MQIGMLGLGRMGMNMARRLLRGGHEVVAWNRSPEKIDQLVKEGAVGAYSLEEFTARLAPPRAVWIMLPAGPVVQDMISQLREILDPGDIIIEGGNSHYKDDLRIAAKLEERGIVYLDAGVSGGIWGLSIGYCTMVGGPREAFEHLEPAFKTLAPEGGYLHCGPTGAGHFVKMVHNGIEYGLMQAYAEGFEIMDASPYGKNLDFAQVSRLWNRGSVIRSWLLELAEGVFQKDPLLKDVADIVEDSGEGRWAVQQAVETSVPAPVLAASLFARFRSQQESSFSGRLLASLRHAFGGHGVTRKGPTL